MLSQSCTVEQLITYSAYGSVAAVHGGTGNVIGTSEAAAITSILYSGEAFDHTIQKGYNRDRWYDPRSAQWNHLDVDEVGLRKQADHCRSLGRLKESIDQWNVLAQSKVAR